MNAAGSESSAPLEDELPPRESWSFPRWVAYVALAFALHIGLIFIFGNRKPIVPRSVANPPAIQFTAGRSELLTLDDPTLFALPHSRGFAAASWLQLPRVEFAPFRWTEPPQFMALPFTKLGNTFFAYAQTNISPPLKLETLPPPAFIPSDVSDPLTTLKQRSTVRLSASLTSRRWLNSPALLRSWPASDLLTNTLVRVMVETDGQVFSPAVMPPGSGSKQADQIALEIARSARFAPVKRDAAKSTVGFLIFEWHTAPLAETTKPSATP